VNALAVVVLAGFVLLLLAGVVPSVRARLESAGLGFAFAWAVVAVALAVVVLVD
jgi:hypothetical protein